MPRIAVLSTAHIHTKGFLTNLREGADGRTVHVIWDDDAERGARYAAEFGTVHSTDLDAVVADPQVDGFLICAENTRHLRLLEAALPVGKPVFCEKPLVTTTKELKRVAALQRAHGTPLLSGYFKPYSGDLRAVANLIRGGFFGKITRVRYRNAHHAAYGRWFDHPDLAWFHQPELAGGGAFMDMGTHAVHLLRSLFGPVEKVWAHLANHSGEYPAVDDFGVAHLAFADGLWGTVEAAWTQTGGPVGLEIVGSEKTLFHNGAGYQIRGPSFSQEPLLTIEPAPSRVDRLIAVIRGEVPAEEVAAELGAIYDAVSVVEACYASSAKQRWAKVTRVAP